MQLSTPFAQTTPLAQRVRPTKLSQVAGFKKAEYFERLISTKYVPSTVFWGPPGSGKTTIASIISSKLALPSINYSAVTGNIKEIKAILNQAKKRIEFENKQTILFVDEIHHFNKSQQDAFLPFLEKGIIILLGATIENPSFYLNRALLSRVKIVVIEPPDSKEITKILIRALKQDQFCSSIISSYDEQVLNNIATISGGDVRRSLNLLEELCYLASSTEQKNIDESLFAKMDESAVCKHDKAGDEHYNIISAFIKSMRGSDPDAALYWLARMLEAGEQPNFILRRMIIFAGEDIGMADPRALETIISAHNAFQIIGMPEGFIPLAFSTVYLSTAPKSNSAYAGYKKAQKEIKKTGSLKPPSHILNAPTKLMKKLGYGKGYQYPHQFDNNFVPDVSYLPKIIENQKFYIPSNSGYEKKVTQYWKEIKKRLTEKK